MSSLRFVWDAPKAARNLRKHRVSFEEAQTIFDDPDVLIKPDIEHSILEDRAHAVGISKRLRILVVVVVDVDEDVIRIIPLVAPRRMKRQSMRKGKHDVRKAKAPQAKEIESPAEVDFSRGLVFQGVENWRKYLSWKRDYVKLDPDVRKLLPRDQDVNEVLRHSLAIVRTIASAKRRKSA